MTDINTAEGRKALLERVREYAHAHKATQTEKDEHAISFVLGNLNASTNHQTTRDKVEAQYYKLEREKALAKIAELEAQPSEIEAQRQESFAHFEDVARQNAALQQQVAALRADKERLDWLASRVILDMPIIPSDGAHRLIYSSLSSNTNNIREAIDAARATAAQEGE